MRLSTRSRQFISSPPGGAALPLGVLLLLQSAQSAHGQTWEMAQTTTVTATTNATYSNNCNGGPSPPCCSEISAAGPTTSGTVAFQDLLGWDWWWGSHIDLKDDPNCGFMKAKADLDFRIRGLGTATVVIRWDGAARTIERCDNAPGAYSGNAKANYTASVDLTVADLPTGTPVTVFYRWSHVSVNSFSPEAVFDDTDTKILGGSLWITSGIPTILFDTNYDLVNTKGALFNPGAVGSFIAPAGSTINVFNDVLLESTVTPPARAEPQFPFPCEIRCNKETDYEAVGWTGQLELSIGVPLQGPPDWTQEPDPDVLFSVDIGGDAELFDPSTDGNEVFDPGDAYVWHGPPLPAGGASGIFDDAPMYGFDPSPTPGFPDAAFSCSGLDPSVVIGAFDLDDIDVIDFDPRAFIPSSAPMPAPVARFPSAFVHTLEFSAISYEDDGPEHYFTLVPTPLGLTCSVPVGSISAGGSADRGTFGRTDRRDEIELIPWLSRGGLGSPLPILTGSFPGFDESSIHINLAPNPDADDTADDDVDAIDIVPAAADPNAHFVIFTVDHEAWGSAPTTLPPGGVVWLREPGGIVTPLIDPIIHLGLPVTVDIRALEFVWLPTAPGAPDMLALVFSVAPDDPATAGDESGGLDPRKLYASHLNAGPGGGLGPPTISPPFEITEVALDADIDAFSNYRRPLDADDAPPIPCMGDANCNFLVNFSDITEVLGHWGATYTSGVFCGYGDANHNGTVNFADITVILVNFNDVCPY